MANAKSSVPVLPLDKPIFKTAYGPHLKVTHESEAPSRTKQSFKDDCDVNNIMARFTKTGVIDFVNRHAARYGDCTGVTFANASATVAAAKSMFHDLPARVRDRFENDPAKFLDFVNNPLNKAEARELGLLKPEAPKAPDAAAAAPEPQAKGGEAAPTTTPKGGQ